MVWNISLGFVEIGSKGVEVKPQLKFGYEDEHQKVGGGIGDVRDGLNISAGASARVAGRSQGTTVDELCRNVKFDSPVPEVKKFVDLLLKTLLQGLAHHPVNVALQAMGLDIIKVISSGKMMKAKLQYSYGVGVKAGVKLGWCDTSGYHMVGAEAGVKAVVPLSGTVYAGGQTL